MLCWRYLEKSRSISSGFTPMGIWSLSVQISKATSTTRVCSWSLKICHWSVPWMEAKKKKHRAIERATGGIRESSTGRRNHSRSECGFRTLRAGEKLLKIKHNPCGDCSKYCAMHSWKGSYKVYLRHQQDSPLISQNFSCAACFCVFYTAETEKGHMMVQLQCDFMMHTHVFRGKAPSRGEQRGRPEILMKGCRAFPDI